MYGTDIFADSGAVIQVSSLANLLTFLTLYSSQQAFRRPSLHACHSTRSLSFFDTNLFSAPFVRTSFGAGSFSVAAPKICNSLPPSLRTCTSPDTFRRYLKTPTASRPSNMLNPFLLVPQMRLLLTTVHVYLYLLTYSSLLHTCMSQWPSGQRVRLRCQRTQVRISPPTVAFCLFVCLIVCLFINPHQERETQFHKRSTI